MVMHYVQMEFLWLYFLAGGYISILSAIMENSHRNMHTCKYKLSFHWVWLIIILAITSVQTSYKNLGQLPLNAIVDHLTILDQDQSMNDQDIC